MKFSRAQREQDQLSLANGASWEAATWTGGPRGRVSGRERVKTSSRNIDNVFHQFKLSSTLASRQLERPVRRLP